MTSQEISDHLSKKYSVNVEKRTITNWLDSLVNLGICSKEVITTNHGHGNVSRKRTIYLNNFNRLKVERDLKSVAMMLL